MPEKLTSKMGKEGTVIAMQLLLVLPYHSNNAPNSLPLVLHHGKWVYTLLYTQATGNVARDGTLWTGLENCLFQLSPKYSV